MMCLCRGFALYFRRTPEQILWSPFLQLSILQTTRRVESSKMVDVKRNYCGPYWLNRTLFAILTSACRQREYYLHHNFALLFQPPFYFTTARRVEAFWDMHHQGLCCHDRYFVSADSFIKTRWVCFIVFTIQNLKSCTLGPILLSSFHPLQRPACNLPQPIDYFRMEW